MLTPYRELFVTPGTKGFSGAGFVGKLPAGMLSIGIVTMISELTGRYRVAGALAATFALSMALIGPQISRLVDQFGQRRVLRPAVLVTVAAIVGLVVCASLDTPTWTWFACTALAGCTPSMGAMVRARWANLHGGTPQLHTAYSFESVLDEMCFIIGPVISVGLCTALFPAAGPVLAIGCLAVGVFAFTAQRSTEPPPHPRTHQQKRSSALRTPGLLVIMGTLGTAGAIFGSVDVVTVAFAEEQGQKGSASLVLASYALGSCLAGLVFGLVRPKGPATRRFLIGVVVMAATMLPLRFAPNLQVLSVMVFVSGLAIAPTVVTAMGLVERIVPRPRLTEGMTWVSAGIGVGLAVGAAVAGWAVDHSGAQSAYLVPAASGGVGVLLAATGLRQLSSAASARPAAPAASGSGAPGTAAPGDGASAAEAPVAGIPVAGEPVEPASGSLPAAGGSSPVPQGSDG